MQLRNLLKCTILLPDTDKSQPAPLGTGWDFNFDRKYIFMHSIALGCNLSRGFLTKILTVANAE